MEINYKSVFWSMLIALMLIGTMGIVFGESTTSLSVRPLSAGEIQASTTFSYDIVFSDNNDCTFPELNLSGISVTTDAYGLGNIELNTTGLNRSVAYICEFRDTALIKVHNTSSILATKVLFTEAYGNNINVSGQVTASTFDDGLGDIGFQVPIGGLVFWYNFSSTGTIPERYQLADGSVINDAESPMNGMYTLNLIDTFVQGGTDNSTGGSTSHNHMWYQAAGTNSANGNTYNSGGSAVAISGLDTDLANNARFGVATGTTDSDGTETTTYMTTDTYSSNEDGSPPYQKMLPLMRIK